MRLPLTCIEAQGVHVEIVLAVGQFFHPLGIWLHGQEEVDASLPQAGHGLLGGDFHQLVGPVQILGQLRQMLAVKMAHIQGAGHGRVRPQVADAYGNRSRLIGGRRRRRLDSGRPVAVPPEDGGEQQGHCQEGHQEKFV